MALDTRFFTAPSLQMYFVDKLTGAPLTAGKVRFYKDIARTVPKSIYKLSGSPPNYTYTDIGSEITLTGVGTFSDSLGNDIIPYYFPFDGTPSTTTDTVELYYIRVFNSGEVEQFVREGWPNVGDLLSSGSNDYNYIPNGQLLVHTDIPADVPNEYEAGEIRADITDIAQGNFTFERSPGALSTDFVVFTRSGDYVDNPTGSPRYAARVSCSDPGAGTSYKDLRIKFMDVNKFSSPDANPQSYTFSVTGKANIGSSGTVRIFLIKNFGSGGSAPSAEEIGVLTFNNSYSIGNIYFTFGNNEDETVGPNNDDFVQIALRFPTDEVFDMSVTNFILSFGQVNITSFPVTTNLEFLDSALNPRTFSTTGSDLGLIARSTKNGVEYDQEEVGDIVSSIRLTKKWHHLCDGTQLLTAGYQSTGVPNSRLQAVLWNELFGIPKYGTGEFFCTARNPANPMVFTNNTAGAVPATADGTVPTGFTFSRVHIGNSGYGVYSFNIFAPTMHTGDFVIWNVAFGAAGSSVGTSGFSKSTIRSGSGSRAEITRWTAIAPATLAGKYFQFSNPTTSYYVWFKVDGTGTDPAPGGTGILVNLLSTDSPSGVAEKVSAALTGAEQTAVTTVAGSAIVPGAYFNFQTVGGPTTLYYVWYQRNGVGTDPTPSGRTGIKVSILSTDTLTQVQTKTVIAMNSMYFAVPDFRGQFLRGLDKAFNYDTDLRFSFVYGIGGLSIGSFQFDNNLEHQHMYQTVGPGTGIAEGASTISLIQTLSANSGGTESVPYNAAVNFFIKY